MRLTWVQRINRARKRGRFTRRDYTDASDWTTCAVGERLGVNWQKRSSRLTRFGWRFENAVHYDCINDAAKLAAKIAAYKGKEAL